MIHGCQLFSIIRIVFMVSCWVKVSARRIVSSSAAFLSAKHVPLIDVQRYGNRQKSLLLPNEGILQHHSWVSRLGFLVRRPMMSTDDSNNNENGETTATTSTTTTLEEKPMANLYHEWTLEQDKILWENCGKPTSELAALLGRGLRGVEARLSKLKDCDTNAYERLFSYNNKHENKNEEAEASSKKDKLVPVSEVLRRIQWDYSLPQEHFSVLYYDRVEDKVMESPFAAPNKSIAGKEDKFVLALPEHRIVAVKYKERIVWDREERLDTFFSSSGAGGIEKIMEKYDEWKRNKDAVEQWNKHRQRLVSDQLRRILGLEYYDELKQLASNYLKSSSVAEDDDDCSSKRQDAKKFIQTALDICRAIRNDPSLSLEPSLIPTSDDAALDLLSELIAVLPNAPLRNILLSEMYIAMNSDRVEGDQKQKNIGNRPKDKNKNQNSLPQLAEDEITESFVRGSGAGGQKINKTSNKVILVHEPTQIRVECQETRSLQQNRKIARKRLRLKLDEYLNGNQSKLAQKAQKASTKKQKAKARNRARQRKKKLQKKRVDATNHSDENDDSDDLYEIIDDDQYQ